MTVAYGAIQLFGLRGNACVLHVWWTSVNKQGNVLLPTIIPAAYYCINSESDVTAPPFRNPFFSSPFPTLHVLTRHCNNTKYLV